MAIEIEKRFRVGAPVERVWAFLTDLERVAECLQGASITGREPDGAWSGTMKVKLGPVSSSYQGTVRFDWTDEAAHTAELSAEGRDVRGKGAADMTMRSELTASDGGTEVHVASTVYVTGVLASMGRGMIEDVSDQLFGRFTACVREKLEGERDEEEQAVPDEAARREEPTTADPGQGDTGDRPAVATAAHPPGRPRADEEALQLGGLGAWALGRALVRTLRRPLVWILAALVALAVWSLTR